MYLSWAAFYEGPGDKAYFSVLLPRIIESILLMECNFPIVVPDNPAVVIGLDSRVVDVVAQEICANEEAYHILFIHADTGGRAIAADIVQRREAYVDRARQICDVNPARIVFLSPRHETEAWALADSEAVCAALGYSGRTGRLGLPRNALAAERLADPKAVLRGVAERVQGRRARRPGRELLTVIAQEQRIDRLRGSRSFREFEAGLRAAFVSLGCL
jgi:hypothetical protein